MQRKPIVYSELIDIRFSDLDMYGHVNSKHYIDIVATARLIFLKENMKVSVEEVAKRGVAFYMTKSTIQYKKPILGLQKVRASSFVREVKDGKTLVIPFTISNLGDDKIYSDGELEFALIDMTSKRTTPAPDWLLDLFFEMA